MAIFIIRFNCNVSFAMDVNLHCRIISIFSESVFLKQESGLQDRSKTFLVEEEPNRGL